MSVTKIKQFLVPTLCVGMQPGRSASCFRLPETVFLPCGHPDAERPACIPSQSVGTRCAVLVTLKSNNAKIKSPINQVNSYKKNMYNLHIENLLEKSINESKIWSIISCGVYFHRSTKGEAYRLLTDDFKNDKKYKNYLTLFASLEA